LTSIASLISFADNQAGASSSPKAFASFAAAIPISNKFPLDKVLQKAGIPFEKTKRGIPETFRYCEKD